MTRVMGFWRVAGATWLVLVFAFVAACGRDLPTRVQPPPPNAHFVAMDWPYDITSDGQTLIYRHRPSRDFTGGVYMVSTEPEGRPTILYADSLPFFVNDCRFSPDGTKIAYTRDFRSDIYVLNLKDGSDTRVTFTDGNARTPDWDPTGRWIVYMRVWLTYGEPDSIGGIHIVDTETLADRSLRALGTVVFGSNPRWSPDGAAITYHLGMPSHILKAQADGSGYTNLTPGESSNNEFPMWLEAGKIIFESYGASSFLEHVTQTIRADGTGRATLPADLRPYIGFAAVAPGVEKFVYTGPDSAGDWGVVLIRDLDDGTGSSVRQLTVYVPPDSADGRALP